VAQETIKFSDLQEVESLKADLVAVLAKYQALAWTVEDKAEWDMTQGCKRQGEEREYLLHDN
jgi:hypothetical protein